MLRSITDLTAPNISFINIFGVYLATKSDAMQDWSGPYCDVSSLSLTDAAGTMLSPTVGVLTFKAAADGTCYGQKVGPIWARRSTLNPAMAGNGPSASTYPQAGRALRDCGRHAPEFSNPQLYPQFLYPCAACAAFWQSPRLSKL